MIKESLNSTYNKICFISFFKKISCQVFMNTVEIKIILNSLKIIKILKLLRIYQRYTRNIKWSIKFNPA